MTVRFPYLVFLIFAFGWHTSLSGQTRADDLAAWKVTGGLSADASRPGHAGGSSWKLEPGAVAELPLRDADASGEVTFWVFDDGTDSAGKTRYVGPQWGVKQSDGRTLALAICYAPYLAEKGSYTASDYTKTYFENLQYLDQRKPGKWTKWTIRFDPQEGASIFINDKKSRFDWNKRQAKGFSSLVLIGSSPKGSTKPQTLWVSDISYQLGGKMEAAPTPSPPPPPVLPESDPEAEGAVPKLVPREHPRLMFSQEDIPRMRAYYESDQGKVWRERMEKMLGSCRAPSKEDAVFVKPNNSGSDTDGQRQGFWRLPTVALHYVLTGDTTSRDKAIAYLQLFNSLPDWQTSGERNSGMGSANIMLGAALAYDWLYHDLDPAFREQFREKLWEMARWQYHGGHLKKNPGLHYWQNDPANNHRWMRNAGMATAAFVSYTGDPSQDWLLQRVAEEIAYIAENLPADGTSHEGVGYFIFGTDHLAIFMTASDNVLGTNYLDQPFFENAVHYRLHASTSDLGNVLRYGDDSPGTTGFYGNVLTLSAAESGDPGIKGKVRDLVENAPTLMMYPWLSVIWDDPKLAIAATDNYETVALFPDVGVTYLRDTWGEEGVSAMFKCGPFGGYHLNHYRDKKKGNYINVAHDDPDANTFLLARGKTVLAETDGYSRRKASQNHNTILVNGMGQMSKGRPEGVVWTQPAVGETSMAEMAYLTAWQADGAVIAMEGEAAGSYLATKNKKSGQSRPGLDRYRRTFLWLDGNYILVLDDIRSPEPVEITWMIQSRQVEEQADGRFTLMADGESCPAQLVSDQSFTTAVIESPADNKGKPLGHRQLRATVDASAVRFASVYNIWNGEELTVELKNEGADRATVTVQSADFTDEWTWQAAPDAKVPSRLTGKRLKGPSVEGLPMTLQPYEFKPEPVML